MPNWREHSHDFTKKNRAIFYFCMQFFILLTCIFVVQFIMLGQLFQIYFTQKSIYVICTWTELIINSKNGNPIKYIRTKPINQNMSNLREYMILLSFYVHNLWFYVSCFIVCFHLESYYVVCTLTEFIVNPKDGNIIKYIMIKPHNYQTRMSQYVKLMGIYYDVTAILFYIIYYFIFVVLYFIFI